MYSWMNYYYSSEVLTGLILVQLLVNSVIGYFVISKIWSLTGKKER